MTDAVRYEAIGAGYATTRREDPITVHHWDEGLRDGVRELRRVARGPVAILT